jgi:hypothetical protein
LSHRCSDSSRPCEISSLHFSPVSAFSHFEGVGEKLYPKGEKIGVMAGFVLPGLAATARHFALRMERTAHAEVKCGAIKHLGPVSF